MFAVLPIVAMTANAMQMDRERCLQAGMNDFVTKPIQTTELWQALLKWVQVRPGLGIPAPALAHLSPLTNDGQAQSLEPALRGIAQLDVDLGLQRTGNKPAFYVSMLKKFVASQQGAAQGIADSLALADMGAAERIAHTLKGVAANLGATPLQDSAAALETLIREGGAPSELGPVLQACARQLDTLVQALHAVLAQAAEPDGAAPEVSEDERARAQTLVAQLKQLLAEDDASALHLWESHVHLLRQVVADAERVEAALQAYDFERAAALMPA